MSLKPDQKKYDDLDIHQKIYLKAHLLKPENITFVFKIKTKRNLLQIVNTWLKKYRF